ncbi:MAG: 6-hydroxymethylpterin diphosphokinase MptE-like protein [Gammaproteobacteria bacterium]
MKPKKGDRATLLQIEERRLIEELPLRGGIFLPTEAVPVAERVAGLKRVRAIYEWWWKREYAPRLRELRRQYAGKGRCFIIGNGPSLNRTDLTKLCDEVTFGVNGLFLKFDEMGFSPTFYVVEDHLVAEDRAQEINAIKGPLKLFPFHLAYCLDEGPDTLFFNHRPRPSPTGFEFSTDASRITYTGCTVTFTCMQLAFYLGFPEIYLVGVDASYEIPKTVERHDHYGVAVLDMQGDDPNHFHPDYFGKGYRWHDPQVDKMVAAYEEARRVTEARGVRIRNATIGGKLEVFERVDYESLFRPDGAGTMSLFPRVLILDMTCLGSSSATGQIKKTLFTGWPLGRLAQVFAAGHGRFGLYRGDAVPAALDDPSDPAEAVAWCRSFDPDVVYFRPHDHPHYFHEFALRAIDALGVPLCTHLMDDWPARAGARGAFGNDRLTRRLPRLLERSAVRLSISEAMSSAFETRYGLRFRAIANVVEPAVWQALDGERATRRAATEPLLMRYVGGLADDMGLRSLTDVAEVVDKLHEELGVRLEVHTVRTWKTKADAVFGRSRGVSVHEAGISEEGYRRLLIGCHLLLIAYNFDSRSIAYVRYSMANKMPECLASGVPVMAYGPISIATVAYLAEHRVAEMVTTRDPALLETALRRFTGDPDYGRSLGARGRAFAFERHPAKAVRERLHASLSEAASQHGFAPGVKPKGSDDAGLCGCHARRARLTINERTLVAEVLSQTEGGIVMAVGARAHDTLAPFVTGGFTVHTLPPDPTTAVGAGPRARPEPDRGSNNIKGAEHIAPTTVRELIEERGLSRLDLLMVDGPDLGILQDVPWAEHRPRFVMCGFDEEEARRTGHTLHDLTRLLVAQGYRIWISEWHPPTRFRHFGPKFMKAGLRRWRRLVPYPCHLGSPRAWGYCIATRDTADAEALAQAARRAIESLSPTRSIPWLGLTFQRSVPKVQRGVTKLKRWARALTNRARAGLVAYLDAHHPDASASLRAALRRLRSSPL